MSGSDEYIYGINAISEMLGSHPADVREILLARDRRDPRIKQLLELADKAGIKVHPRPTEVLTRLAGNEHHQGLVAVVRGFSYAELSDLQRILSEKQENGQVPLVLVLDSIQDPGNLGGLIRSAHVLGAHGVIIPQDRAAGVTPAVRKASAGALAHMPIVQVVNLARTLEKLFEDSGLWVLGLDQEAPKMLSGLDLTVPLALVVGSEGKGMRPLTRKHCQMLGKIPQISHAGGVDSLNASVAGAIALYEIARQRGL